MIITISRETGSGGHTIGKLLAETLGYRFYDKEIVADVAKKMQIDEAVVLENGETMSDQTYLDMTSGFIPFSRKEKIPFDAIKATQDMLIREIAEQDNAVIVGRGADDILKASPNAFHIFIHANMEHRVARVQKQQQLSGQELRIQRELEVKDHARSMYYKYFSGREWGKVGNYNLVIDTSVFSEAQSLALILTAIDLWKENKENA